MKIRNHDLKKYDFRNYDFFLVLSVLALSIIGILAIGSADPDGQQKQIYGLIFSIVVMLFISLIDYTFFTRFYWIYYIINIVLLSLVLSPLGSSTNGSQRWIKLAGITFQPSEAAKILLILFYAQFIMRYRNKIKTLGFCLLCLGLLGPCIVLILIQPDLSTTIMITLIVSSILFVAGINWKIVGAVLITVVPSALYIIISTLNGTSFLRDYQQRRILAWFHPEDYANSDAYQTLNSMMAIGSGQLYGKGYNTNEISSVLNGGFISESQTDFIFSVVGEEFGFIGSCIVIALLLFIAIDCFIISSKSKDMAGKVIAAGVGAWIGFQGFLNIGVVTGAMPNTGLPLPFVSSGLTSLVCVYGGIGFVLNVRLSSKKY